MAAKQRRKVEELREQVFVMDAVKVYGAEDAEVTLVGWGSTKGPALEALKVLAEESVSARFVQVVLMEPFPSEAVSEALKTNGPTLLIEGNRTAQLGRLIKLHCGIEFEHVYLRYDGRPFNPGEIAARAKEAMA